MATARRLQEGAPFLLPTHLKKGPLADPPRLREVAEAGGGTCWLSLRIGRPSQGRRGEKYSPWVRREGSGGALE